MLGFLSFDREAEQYLCAAVLRLGKAVAADGTLGLLSRLLPLLRAAFPRARFLVRLDGGFATPEIFDFLDAEPRLDYVVAMAKNAVLQRHAESAMQVARAQSEVGGETAHVYTDTRYAARTWDHERRVVIKAEVVRLGDREPRDNPRFVVTNLRQTPRFIYEKEPLAKRVIGRVFPCRRRRGEGRSAGGMQRSQDGSDRAREAGDTGVHGACLPVMRASAREERWRISFTSRSSLRLFSIHSR